MTDFVPPTTLAGPAAWPVQEGIPPTRAQRQALADAARGHVRRHCPVPPLSLEELRVHTEAVLQASRTPGGFRRFAAVVVHNEVWREQLARIPYHRRLLLLPKCLRDAEDCPATMDPYGLVCQGCGRCVIGEFQSEARRLGYVVLVAEGSPVVTSLIESGQVQAVVGVSCLGVLQKVFPYMEAAAIPGLAIPLLRDGCANTGVDVDWVWEAIAVTSDDRTGLLDLNALRASVEEWFSPRGLDGLLGPADGQTERIARDWLSRSGKRWRPFLAVCAFQAFQQDQEAPLPADLRGIALAVECFHKASLVHDDIEDNDAVRYGQRTLHEEYGVPVALNVGDFLLGEGYRLIGACAAAPAWRAEMLKVAARGHRELSLGQGAELCWRRDRRVLSSAEVLEIYARKTAPAFEVALRLGALLAGADSSVGEALRRYSQALGVAYQITDDLSDFSGNDPSDDLAHQRPSYLLALGCQRAGGAEEALLEALWRGPVQSEQVRRARNVLGDLKVEPAARAAVEGYLRQAIRALHPLDNPSLKGLLRRVLGRIFDQMPAMECCHDHQAGDAPGRAQGGAGAG